MNLEHEWKDTKKTKVLFWSDRSPIVHIGTANPILPALEAKEAFQNQLPRDSQEWGLQAQKKHTKHREVANGKPFRY